MNKLPQNGRVAKLTQQGVLIAASFSMEPEH